MPCQGVGAQLGASELKAWGDSGKLLAEDQLSWGSQYHLQMLQRSRAAVGLEHWRLEAGSHS